jgi:hypothetical protein
MVDGEELARCTKEIAQVEAQLRAGHRDLEGLLLALLDWSRERQMIESGRCRWELPQ